jgi:hypothetical protein
VLPEVLGRAQRRRGRTHGRLAAEDPLLSLGTFSQLTCRPSIFVENQQKLVLIFVDEKKEKRKSKRIIFFSLFFFLLSLFPHNNNNSRP